MNGIERSVLVASLPLLVVACGRKGALIYPDTLVPAAPSVSAWQSGSAVKLQFSIPTRDRSGRSVQGVAGVKISRRVNDADRKDICRSCSTDYTLFRTLYLDLLPSNTRRFGNRMILLDSDVGAGNLYSYRIVPFLADGVDGAASAAVDVHVGAPLPPPVVKIVSLPTEVKLYLSMPPKTGGQLLGYNLYRTSGTTASWPWQPQNSEPVKGGEYTDSTLERGVSYRYRATAVMVQETGAVVESSESDVVEGMLKEDE
jgi:predicted small lipoprotein YifL